MLNGGAHARWPVTMRSPRDASRPECDRDVDNEPVDDSHTCQCCGRIVAGPFGSYTVCPRCGWEDFAPPGHDYKKTWDGNPNGIDLAEAQRRYQRYGEIYPGSPRKLGQTSESAEDPDWRPLEQSQQNIYRDFVRDLSYLVISQAEQTKETILTQGGSKLTQARLATLTQVLTLIANQADVYKLDPEEIGFPEDFDIFRDLTADPPPDASAG